MLQIQYYNKGLSKTQIEQIIKNYNIKYTRLTNEINLKLNSIIKTVLNDYHTIFRMLIFGFSIISWNLFFDFTTQKRNKIINSFI